MFYESVQEYRADKMRKEMQRRYLADRRRKANEAFALFQAERRQGERRINND